MKTPPWEIYYKRVQTRFLSELPEIFTVFKKNKVTRVLDFGCGTGRNSIYLAKSGFQVYGFDISNAAIEQAKANLAKRGLNAHLRVWNMLDPLPYGNNIFDAVIAVRAMYHARVSDIKKVVREVVRITKKNGYLFLYGPTYKQFLEYKKRGQRSKEIEHKTYVDTAGPLRGIPYHYFTKEELRKIFGRFYIIKYITLKGKVFSLLAQKK